jgi:hypothetical protein
MNEAIHPKYDTEKRAFARLPMNRIMTKITAAPTVLTAIMKKPNARPG